MDCDGDGEMRLVGLVVMLVASVAAVVSLIVFALSAGFRCAQESRF